MPSNTAHIQQRAQLKQHDDLVIAVDEQTEWHEGQNELGLPSTPGVRSRPAPVRECAVSTIPSLFQRSDRLNKVQTPQVNLADMARHRASSKVLGLLGAAAKATKAVKNRHRIPPATFREAQDFDDRNGASRYRSREYAATVSS
ncbi:hypothetical protein KCU81_g3192, partial [Aureobasidium melanogenum]|uniref:Uncharacterized protein n=1 Tax=Aureobasidium melanogenum (strain CBS 110374) TaxID=1043003 RepID=A0A074VMB1_AURM1